MYSSATGLQRDATSCVQIGLDQANHNGVLETSRHVCVTQAMNFPVLGTFFQNTDTHAQTFTPAALQTLESSAVIASQRFDHPTQEAAALAAHCQVNAIAAAVAGSPEDRSQ